MIATINQKASSQRRGSHEDVVAGEPVGRTSSALHVLHSEESTMQRIEPPADRGRLLTAAQVAAQLFNGTVSAAWVRRNVPRKLVLGHSTVRWYAGDVQAWINTCASPVVATNC